MWNYSEIMPAVAVLPWVISASLVAVFLFFSYHIIVASLKYDAEKDSPKHAINSIYHTEQNFRPVAPANIIRPPLRESVVEDNMASDWSEPIEKNDVPLLPPKVAGQTKEDLTAPEPLQETPPTTLYEPPEATDAMNKTVNMNATFGSNLRHPEQMIEKRPRRTMKKPLQSGVASEQSFNFGRQETQYSEEMIQNGGIMEDGIIAHDNSNSGYGRGLAFSML